MSGKYYHYEGGASVSIPIEISKALDWEHKDDVEVKIKIIDGKMGLFLTKIDSMKPIVF
ncbi:MAG: hypothetical protein GY870_21845 [archaeon]|nr:hypothetical protein [archaeon]